MSERGSFCTEYIYCKDCLEAVRKAILKEVDVEAIQIPITPKCDKLFPIFAGKVSSTYSGGELHVIEMLIEELESELCHTVDIAVLPDGGGARILTAMPKIDRHNLIEYKQDHDGSWWWSETRCRQCGMLLQAEGGLFSQPLTKPSSRCSEQYD